MEDSLVTAVNNYYDRSTTAEDRKAIERDLIALRSQPVSAINACTTALSSTALTQSGCVLILSILHPALSGGWIHGVDDAVRNELFNLLSGLALPPAGTAVSAAVSSMAGKALALFVLDTAEDTFPFTWDAVMRSLQANDATTTYALRVLQEMLAAWFTDSAGKDGSSKTAGNEKVKADLKEAIITQLSSLFEVFGSLLSQRSELLAASPTRIATFDRSITEPLLGTLEQLIMAIPHPAYASAEFLTCLQEIALGAVNSRCNDTGCQAVGVVTAIINKQLIPNESFDIICNLSALLVQLVAVACGGSVPEGASPFEFTLGGDQLSAAADIDDGTFTVLLDFLRAWFVYVLPKAEGIPDFPLMKLFELLYHFSLVQTEAGRLTESLALWISICNRIAEKSEQTIQGRCDYDSVFITLADQMLGKIQMRTNSAGLEALSDVEALTLSCSADTDDGFAFKVDGGFSTGKTVPRHRVTTSVIVGDAPRRGGLPSEPYHVDLDTSGGHDWFDEEIDEQPSLRARTVLADVSTTDDIIDTVQNDLVPSAKTARAVFLRHCLLLTQTICRVPSVLESILPTAGDILMTNVAEVCAQCVALDGGGQASVDVVAQLVSLQDAITMLQLLCSIVPTIPLFPAATSAHDGLLSIITQLAQEASSRSWHLRGGKFSQLYCQVLLAFVSRLPAVSASVLNGFQEDIVQAQAHIKLMDVVVDAAVTALDSSVLPPSAELSAAGARLFTSISTNEAIRSLLRVCGTSSTAFQTIFGVEGAAKNLQLILGGLRPYHQGQIVASVVRLLLVPPVSSVASADIPLADRVAAAAGFLEPYCGALAASFSASGTAPPLLNDRSVQAKVCRFIGLLAATLKLTKNDHAALHKALGPILHGVVDVCVGNAGILASTGSFPRGLMAPLSQLGDVLYLAALTVSTCRRDIGEPTITAWASAMLPLLQHLCAIHAADSKPAGFIVALVAGIRFLRACAASGPRGISLSPEGITACDNTRNMIAEFLCNELKAASHPGTTIADDIAPSAIALARDFIRDNWTYLTARREGGQREFASSEHANITTAILGILHVWLSNAFGSLEIFRLALFSIAALDRDCNIFAIFNTGVPGEVSFVQELQVTLLDSILSGDRLSMGDEITKLLVQSAKTNKDAFTSFCLPAWQTSRRSEPGDISKSDDGAIKAISARILRLLTEA